MLEVHVVLLAFANLKCRLGEECQHLSQLVGAALLHAFIGQYKHRVAREDSRVGIPAAVYRLVTSAQVGVVHEIVVQQRVVMVGFQCTCRREDTLRVILEHVVAEQHEHGTYAFASQ